MNKNEILWDLESVNVLSKVGWAVATLAEQGMTAQEISECISAGKLSVEAIETLRVKGQIEMDENLW